MPFKSDKQRRYLFSQKPAIARKFVMDESKGVPWTKRPLFKRRSKQNG